MFLLYPIGLMLTYLLLRYFFKYDRIYRGIFAEKREQQWGEIIVFLIYYALLVFIFWSINPQVGVFGRGPKIRPSDANLLGGVAMLGMISCTLGPLSGACVPLTVA